MVIVILAGGHSSRFGCDKALARLGNLTFLERVAGAAVESGLRVLVVGRSEPSRWGLDVITFMPDTYPDCGPLGGLLTGLGAANSDVLLCACDMPLLTGDAFRWLASQVVPEDTHGLVVRREGVPEPLFSIYRFSCADLARDRLHRGLLSLRGLISAGHFGSVPAAAWVGPLLLNVNEPGDIPSSPTG